MRKNHLRAPQFGELLRTERERRGFSLKQLVNQLGAHGVEIGKSALGRYEKDGRIPPPDVLRGLTHVYELPLHMLQEKLSDELEMLGIATRLTGSKRAKPSPALQSKTGALSDAHTADPLSRQSVVPSDHPAILSIHDIAASLGRLQIELGRAAAALIGKKARPAARRRAGPASVPRRDDHGTASERTRGSGA